MSPDELNALITYLSGSGSSDLNAFENLFGLPSNLLAQAALGVPGIDENYISQFVQENVYEDYKGEDPVVLQENANAVLVRLSESLGVAPETMNALVSMVDGGTPADVAVSLLLPEAYSSGFVDDGTKAMLDALQTTLEAHAVAADLSESVITDPVSGDMYTLRPDDEVRDIMESAGLKGQFADPALWALTPDADRLRVAESAKTQADSERKQLRNLEGLLQQYGNSRRVPVVNGSPLYSDPTVTSGLLKFFKDLQTPDQNMYEQMSEQDLEIGSGTSFIDLAGAAGGENATVYQPLIEGSSGALSSTSMLADQQEQAIKAANRYATFAAAAQAQEKGEEGASGIRRQIQDLTGAVPLPYGGVQTRQDSLDAIALSNAIQAKEEATIPGADAVDAFRNFVTTSFPGTDSGSGGGKAEPPRIKLSRDQVLRTVNSLTSPLRGRI